MKVVVLGGRGMLGQSLVTHLRQRGLDVTRPVRGDLDITDLTSCRRVLLGAEAVVNSAAWTKVDDAEDNESGAFSVNSAGAAHVARTCHESGSRLIHISTDYVFAGDGFRPHGESDPLGPRSAYGRTKAAGEWAVGALHPSATIVRTAWLYGPGGPNFVTTMARLAAERPTLSVVTDQRGQPTATMDVARFVGDLLAREPLPGVFHATSQGETSWFGFARAIFEELGLDPLRVGPTTSAAYPLPAPRPAYSVLGHDRSRRMGLQMLPHWRVALSQTIHGVVKGNRA